MNKKLRILMLTKYFSLSNKGGSEYSSYHLTQNLKKLGHKVFVFRGGTIIQLIKFIRQHHVRIIHVNSPSFLPTAVIVGKLLHVPIVLTARDYSLICPLGFCLWHKPTNCSPKKFLFYDIPTYAKHYPSHIFSPLLHLGAKLRSRLWRYCASQVNCIVCISRAEQQIFAANGFRHLHMIYNTTDFLPQKNYPRTNQIIFVGRLTPGKGANLLVSLANKLPSTYKLVVVGSGFLSTALHHPKIILTGQLEHKQVLKFCRQAKLAIFPSIWPEPFGRGALEAIAAGTPVVTSNRGGLPEIVQGKYGLSVEPNPDKLSLAIKAVINNYSKYAENIKKDIKKLNIKFNLQPVSQYEALYSRLTA